jgi:hypothetical protein
MRHAKSNSILLRKKLMDHQNKLNYTNELDRIRVICLRVIQDFQ